MNLVGRTGVILSLSLIGCDTINPAKRIEPLGLRMTSELQRISDAELLATSLPPPDHVLIGRRFDVYRVGDLLVQPVGGLWSGSSTGLGVVVKNLGNDPWEIEAANIVLVPQRQHKGRQGVKREIAPIAGLVFEDQGDVSVLWLPAVYPPGRPFLPGARRICSNVHDALEYRLEEYYKSYENEVLIGRLPQVTVARGSVTYLFLVYSVGYLERAQLRFPLAGASEARIEFGEELGPGIGMKG